MSDTKLRNTWNEQEDRIANAERRLHELYRAREIAIIDLVAYTDAYDSLNSIQSTIKKTEAYLRGAAAHSIMELEK